MDDDKKIIELLEEILKWERVQGIGIVRDIIPKLLDTDEKRHAYENTDGDKTSRDIEKIAKIGKTTVSRWWKEWYSHGILEKVGSKYKKIISLKELEM